MIRKKKKPITKGYFGLERLIRGDFSLDSLIIAQFGSGPQPGNYDCILFSRFYKATKLETLPKYFFGKGMLVKNIWIVSVCVPTELCTSSYRAAAITFPVNRTLIHVDKTCMIFTSLAKLETS